MWIKLKDNYIDTNEIYRIKLINDGAPKNLVTYEIYFKSGQDMVVYETDMSHRELLAQMRIRTECFDDF